ncbi:hypothetical protein [Segetibacter aerophilus]|uniref:Glyoxalase n=1 Tax=Segetibacter aerophilus TaxID=670293 RepID=A0A512BDI7_9BACT|nr:hypothetical protein [Segetibacter aerophilus]GEO10019.1 hypothetical protein SAE01_25150 [Segetibacter aerophilus]
MKFLSLEPFVPSGKDFEASKNLFLEMGFKISWNAGDYVGFENNGCKFILQKYDNTAFAENFMLSVHVDDIEEFSATLKDKQLADKFGIKIGRITSQPYGKELNIIDLAGVCWHFVQ